MVSNFWEICCNVFVSQNATVGSLVIQVRATDQDIGINGAVRYRILKDGLGNWQTFTIDQTTGAILLQKPLDRERQKLYEVSQFLSLLFPSKILYKIFYSWVCKNCST